MQKHQKFKIKSNTIGYASVAGLSLLGLLTICPITTLSTSATSSVFDATNTTELSARVQSSLSISIADHVSVDITPTATGAFTPQTTQLSVSTNNKTGYSLYLNSGNNTNSLISADSANSAAIAAIAGNSTATDMPANSWGYSLNNSGVSATTYSPISATPEVVKSTEATANEDIYDLTFGIKVNNDLPAGIYHNSIVVSAIANPTTITNLNELTYMQEMTPKICEDTAEYQDLDNYVEKQLFDLRDGKTYYVAKLADGNCWMTQNLDLDLSTSKTLTASDTDLNSVESWTPEHDTATEVPEKVENPSQTEDLSWDMGPYVLATPQRGVSCGNLLPGQTLEQCTDFQNIQGWTPYWKSKVTEEGWAGNGSLYVAANLETRTYDPHYTIGNYYQWNAATAGSGKETDAENKNNTEAGTNPLKLVDAKDSICPKGWQLPTSGRNTTTNEGWSFDREDSFYRLLHAYGYPETGSSTEDTALIETEWVYDRGTTTTSIVGPGKTRLDGGPMYFTRSGNISISYSALRGVGGIGYFWTSTARPVDSRTTFTLILFSANVSPSDNYDRWMGMSVRCLAR